MFLLNKSVPHRAIFFSGGFCSFCGHLRHDHSVAAAVFKCRIIREGGKNGNCLSRMFISAARHSLFAFKCSDLLDDHISDVMGVLY